MIQCAIDLIELIGLPFQSLYGIELFDASIIRFGQMCRVCIVTSTSTHLSQSGPTVVILGGTPTANQGNTTPHNSLLTLGPTYHSQNFRNTIHKNNGIHAGQQ